MNYTRFDRHENMSFATQKEILKLINLSNNSELTNMLNGMFDGYIYNKIMVIGREEFDGDTLERLEAVVDTVRNYPQKYVNI